MWLILSPGGLRDQRRRSDAERLRQCQDDHHQISRHPHRGDRLLPEPAHPVKIGQQVERLHEHAHGHERGHVQQVANHRAFCEILHRSLMPMCIDFSAAQQSRFGTR